MTKEELSAKCPSGVVSVDAADWDVDYDIDDNQLQIVGTVRTPGGMKQLYITVRADGSVDAEQVTGSSVKKTPITDPIAVAPLLEWLGKD